MVFHWRLSDSKSPQVSRTLLSILSVFNNAVVWMVSTQPPTSKSSRPFNNLLVTVPKAPITIGIIVTFMYHSFFQFSSKVKVLNSLFTFFQFYSVVSQDSRYSFFFFLIIIRTGLLAEIRWSVCISKSHFLGQVLGCAYTICCHGQIQFSCTFPSWSPCPPSHV